MLEWSSNNSKVTQFTEPPEKRETLSSTGRLYLLRSYDYTTSFTCAIHFNSHPISLMAQKGFHCCNFEGN